MRRCSGTNHLSEVEQCLLGLRQLLYTSAMDLLVGYTGTCEQDGEKNTHENWKKGGLIHLYSQIGSTLRQPGQEWHGMIWLLSLYHFPSGWTYVSAFSSPLKAQFRQWEVAKLPIASQPQQDLHFKNVLLIFYLPAAVSSLSGNWDKTPFVCKIELGNLQVLFSFLLEAMKNFELLCCLSHCKFASSFLSWIKWLCNYILLLIIE